MGFSARLRLVTDDKAPIERRVAALCDAMTNSSLGFSAARDELEQRFGLVIGEPINSEMLHAAAAFLRAQWEASGFGSGTTTRGR